MRGRQGIPLPRGLTDLDGGPWKTRIAEPQRQGFSRWHGNANARRAVYNNRVRLRSEVGQQAMRTRVELVERSFTYILDRVVCAGRGCGAGNVDKRYLIHVAGTTSGNDAPADRGRDPKWLWRVAGVSCPAPDHLMGHSHGSRREQRRASSDPLQNGL